MAAARSCCGTVGAGFRSRAKTRRRPSRKAIFTSSSKASDFDASEFQNRYIDALKKLIAEKQRKKGKRVIQDDEPDRQPKGSNVVDLMAALKKSIDSGERTPAKRSTARKAPARKSAAKKAPAKKKAAPARKRA